MGDPQMGVASRPRSGSLDEGCGGRRPDSPNRSSGTLRLPRPAGVLLPLRRRYGNHRCKDEGVDAGDEARLATPRAPSTPDRPLAVYEDAVWLTHRLPRAPEERSWHIPL